MLLSLSREYAETGGRLVLVSNETVEGVLDMTRLKGVFTPEGRGFRIARMGRAPRA